jgi:hypothetical protein
MAIRFCAWTARFIRSGMEYGTCSHCGYEGMTFRRRVCSDR